MAEITRQIGLSLGADLCWPACFEEILSRLDLALPLGDDVVRLACERITVEPFDLEQGCKYDLVLDRLTHWLHPSREWVKKVVVMNDAYVLNNPWSIQSMEKHTTYAAMMALGMRVPRSILVPPKEYHHHADLQSTLDRYAQLFDIAEWAKKVGYPLFMKPYDGGAWVGVTRIDNDAQLRDAYEQSGKRVMHLQAAVDPWDLFVRCVAIGPQMNIIKYDPGSALHDRYKVDFHFVDGEEWNELCDMTLTINGFFGWDFNSMEALRDAEGAFWAIDFANACPDSQITSLHYHFPWLVKSLLRWSIFCAATKRAMRKTLDWEPYYAVNRRDLSPREKLSEYAKISHERLETERFKEFCAEHLAHLDEIAWEFFGSPRCKEIFRAKVESLFPGHEVDRFTEHFWGLVQFWRKTDRDLRDRVAGKTSADAKEEAADTESDEEAAAAAE